MSVHLGVTLCVCTWHVLTFSFASKCVSRNTSWLADSLDRSHRFVLCLPHALQEEVLPSLGPILGQQFPIPAACLAKPGLRGFVGFRVVFAGFAGRAPAFECQVPSLLDLMPGYDYALTSSLRNPRAALLIAAVNCN